LRRSRLAEGYADRSNSQFIEELSDLKIFPEYSAGHMWHLVTLQSK